MIHHETAGQTASATRPYANLRFRRHDPDVEHRQDLAESIRQSYAAEGGPVIVSPADVQRQLADRGLVVGQKRIRRMLNDLIADGQLVRQRRGNPYVYEPPERQATFISNARPRAQRGKPPAAPPAAPGAIPPGTPPATPVDLSKVKPRVKLTDAQVLALNLAGCPEHEYRNIQLKTGGAYQCSVRLGDGVYCNRFVGRVASGMADPPAGVNVNPGTLNVDESPGDAGAGDQPEYHAPPGIQEGDYIEGYRRRYGRLPWETDPDVDSDTGGNPATA